MNNLKSRAAAVLSAAVMAVCGGLSSFTSVAAEPREITVYFDFVYDTSLLDLGYRTDGNLTDLSEFATHTVPVGGTVKIPLYKMMINATDTVPALGFGGWTPDGIYAYTSGETYYIPEDYEGDSITFTGSWYEIEAERSVSYSYNLEFEGEPIERPEWLKDAKLRPGEVYEPNYTSIKLEKASSYGLTDGERIYNIGTKLVVTNEDKVFTPLWFRHITITYTTGDVDRVTGNTSVSFNKTEGGRDELAAANRFSRNGFNLVGWQSDYDGEIYKPGETVTFPGVDIIYTAVWEPKSYTVLFKTGNGGTNLKVPGVTDSAIICPDPEHTVAGYTFVGWKDSLGDIYPVGSEYIIKGAVAGGGISLTGVWVEGDVPPATEPPTTEAPTTEPTEPPTTEPTQAPTGDIEVNLGDANCDGIVSIADSTAILQHLGNKDKYALTPQGEKNADCYDVGSGVTAADALAIQRLDANIIESLPDNPEN